MNSELQTETAKWLSAWGKDRVLEGCDGCNGLFVLPPEKVSQRCPYCGQANLAQMNPADDQPVYTQPPELVMPFRAAENQLRSQATRFAKSIWLAPADLSEAALLGRMQPLYLPMWLVDALVQGEWQAEMGFDYEIVTHREAYQNSGWQTQRLNEKRVRWEPRLGRLNRLYENQTAPALEEQVRVEARIGRFNLTEPKSYDPGDMTGAVVRLPNRPPEDAWSDAVMTLQTAVSRDCQLACEANHTRGFKWSPRFANQQWTQLLLPIYTSYYLDDNNQAQMVLLHGQTGKLHGTRRASMKKARRLAGIILAVAAVLLVLTGLLVLLGLTAAEEALAWAGPAGVLTVGVGGTAVIPPLYAWYINSVQAKSTH